MEEAGWTFRKVSMLEGEGLSDESCMQQAAAQILARSNLSRNWLSRHGSETSAEPCDKTEKMSGIPGARRNAYSVITSPVSSTTPSSTSRSVITSPASSSTPSSTSRIAFLNPTASGGIVVPPCRCERKARQAQQSLCTGSVCNDDDVPGSRGRAPLCPHSGTRRTGGSS